MKSTANANSPTQNNVLSILIYYQIIDNKNTRLINDYAVFVNGIRKQAQSLIFGKSAQQQPVLIEAFFENTIANLESRADFCQWLAEDTTSSSYREYEND
jgi:hypothetical protein